MNLKITFVRPLVCFGFVRLRWMTLCVVVDMENNLPRCEHPAGQFAHARYRDLSVDFQRSIRSDEYIFIG